MDKPREAMFFYGHPQNRFWKLMGMFFTKDGHVPATALPSTSPANAAWTLERLAKTWRQILPYL